MKAIRCHLETKSGTPFCLLGCMCEKFTVTCGHGSLASARSAKRKLAANGIRVVIVRGPCLASVPETEKKEIIDYGTINFTADNAPVRRASIICANLGHMRKYKTIGNCLERVTCEICGYSYEIDSSD